VERQQLAQDPEPPLVLRVESDRRVIVNGAEIPLDELSGRLARMFAAREDHVLFFDAADDAEYGYAVEVMDRAREGGAGTTAALTPALSAPSAAQEAAPPSSAP